MWSDCILVVRQHLVTSNIIGWNVLHKKLLGVQGKTVKILLAILSLPLLLKDAVFVEGALSSIDTV